MRNFFKLMFIPFLVFNILCAAKLEVQAAANLSKVLEEIKYAFIKQEGLGKDDIEISYGASGQIYAKIINGLYTDLFISADESFPDKLFQANLSSRPEVYTQGVLVLWSSGDLDVKSLDMVLRAKNVAIPNPKTAPYGRAAMEVLTKSGLIKEVESKLVQGSSISQANQFVLSRSAQIGFNALSMVINQKGASMLIIDEKLYSPIKQAMVMLNNSKNKELAEKFYKFLLDTKAQEIFKSYGYKSL